MTTVSLRNVGICCSHRHNPDDKMLLLSPAKVNLGLSIVGKRRNGYHNLESLFWPVELCDEIQISRSARNEIRIFYCGQASLRKTPLPKSQENIVAQIFNRRTISQLDMILPHSHLITIKKRIPLGSGLGGGSSNAGTIINYFSPFLSFEKRKWIANHIGADVPFFLKPKPSLVSGIGEKVCPIPIEGNSMNRLLFLLVFPPFSCQTARVFNAFSYKKVKNLRKNLTDKFKISTGPTLKNYLSQAVNDLEGTIINLYPSLLPILKVLRKTPCLYAGISGTGSTCVAVYQETPSMADCIKETSVLFRKYNCRSITVKSFIAT